jgi:hypothetical protein
LFKISASLSSWGLNKILKVKLTYYMSLVPVMELIILGRVLISMNLGAIISGILKCIPSPYTFYYRPFSLLKIKALSPPSTTKMNRVPTTPRPRNDRPK